MDIYINWVGTRILCVCFFGTCRSQATIKQSHPLVKRAFGIKDVLEVFKLSSCHSFRQEFIRAPYHVLEAKLHDMILKDLS